MGCLDMNLLHKQAMCYNTIKMLEILHPNMKILKSP